MNAVDKCSLPNRENGIDSPAIISKTKNFLSFYFAFSKFKLNFKHFPEKDDPHSLFISEALACEKRG